MKEVIEGWEYIGSCNCSGGPWNKYTHNDYPGYQIRLHTRGFKFEIRTNGKVLRKGSNGIFKTTYEQVIADFITIS